MTVLAIYFSVFDPEILRKRIIGKKRTKKPRPPIGCPLEAVKERTFKGMRSVLSRGDERYGLICHSKYTSPAATAETTTKCMNSLLTIDCCNVSDAGNQRPVYGYREMGFQTTYFKILDAAGMRDRRHDAMKPLLRRRDCPPFDQRPYHVMSVGR